MSGEEEELRKAILSMFKDKIPLAAAWYKCVSVQGKTCTILMDEDANLKVEGFLLGFDKSGSIEIPKVNTDVLVLFAENSKNHGVVIMCEETVKIELMGKEFKGIPKVDPLVNKLNNLERDLNSLKQILNSLLSTTIMEPGNGAPSAFQAAALTALNPYFSATIIETALIELENKFVVHGKGN